MKHRAMIAALAFTLSASPAFAGTPSGYSTTGPDLLFAATPTGGAETEVGDWNTTQLSVTGGVAASGAVQVGQTAVACGTENAGAIRWNTSTLAFEGCNGSVWQSLGGLTIIEGGCQTYWSSCPTGYIATSYFSPGTYNCCDKCGNPAWRFTVCSR
jgi:hypothetical protein